MNQESTIFGVSTRFLIALVIVSTSCYLAIRGMEINEPLYSVFVMSVGFYFGQKNNSTNTSTSTTSKTEETTIEKELDKVEGK